MGISTTSDQSKIYSNSPLSTGMDELLQGIQLVFINIKMIMDIDMMVDVDMG